MVRSSRPFSVTLLAFGVLIIAGINLYRGIQAAIEWQFLAGLLPALPLYQALSGFFWCLVGLPLAWGLWRGARRAARLVPYAVMAYLLYVWLDRLLLRKDLESASLPFALGLTSLLLFLVFWILSRPRAKYFFREK